MTAGMEIASAMERIRSFEQPVLSMYLNTNPAADMSTEEVRARAKATLDGLQLAEDMREAVLDTIEYTVPWAPSLGLFVGSGKGEVEWIQIPVDLPVHDPTTGQATARVGAPFFTPLQVARDADENFLLVQVDADECQLLDVTPYDIEPVERFQRSSTVRTQGEEASKAEGRPRKVADRGDASQDDRLDDLTTHRRRFFTEIWKSVEWERGRRDPKPRILLMGTARDRAAAKDLLDEPSKKDIALEFGGLSSEQGGPARILEQIGPELREFRESEKAEYLDRIERTGLTGLENGLQAWQRGQLEKVVLPFPSHQDVYVDSGSGYTSTTPDGARVAGPQGTIERRRFDECIERLADDFDVSLSFASGALAVRVENELGGLAAEPRW